MPKTIVILAVVALSACSSDPKALSKPNGQVFRLNPDRWGEPVNEIPRQQAARQ